MFLCIEKKNLLQLYCFIIEKLKSLYSKQVLVFTGRQKAEMVSQTFHFSASKMIVYSGLNPTKLL